MRERKSDEYQDASLSLCSAPTRREFLGTAVAMTTAGVLLPGCSSGGGASGNHSPINTSPIPVEQFQTMPMVPYDDRRVVRVYDRRVTSYTFGADEIAPMVVDAEVLRVMLEAAIIELSRSSTVEEAWAALLPGDLAAAQIAVKVNLNGEEVHHINTSPAMVIALTRSLESVGVTQEALTFFDHSRAYHELYREAIHAEVPGVQLLGASEVAVDETVVVEAPSLVQNDGNHISVPAPACLVEADHFINLHVLKGHSGGSTGALKNLFGLARNVYSTFHGREDRGLTFWDRGLQCAELSDCELIRSKTRLLISEGVYGTWWHAAHPPNRFRNFDLFPDGLPCCLTVGRNPLHHDMVLFDLMREERDYEPLDEGYDYYPDDWLVACAESPLELGVFEHGHLVDGSFTRKDLTYEFIDYRSLTTMT